MRKEIPIVVSVVLLILLVYLDLNKPKPVDWTATYNRSDKNPYGAKVLYDLLGDMFPTKAIQTITKDIYSTLRNFDAPDASVNYVFIADKLDFNALDVEKLLDFVQTGNQAFLAAEEITGAIADSLGIVVESAWLHQLATQADSSLHFTTPQLANSTYAFKRQSIGFYFSQFDSLKTTVLAQTTTASPVYIKVAWGNGYFYLASTPKVFTNYYMLEQQGAIYIAQALSHLPVTTTFWDAYYKNNVRENSSPLRYIAKTAALRWAMWLTLLSVLLFVLFEAKRRQRIVPIIKPLANTTLQFTKTVGALYFQHGDHKDIAEKKITYFFDFLRKRYFLQQITFNQTFYHTLSQKSGVDIANIQAIFTQIQQIRQQAQISDKVLLDLHSKIDDFYQQVQYKS